MRPELRVDWATHEAAKFACETWHYSKSVPVPPLVKVGVWENRKFIGVVIFSRGASNKLLVPFGLKQTEGCELTRIALTKHDAPVSRIVRLAMLFLKQSSPDLRLVVSFADPSEGHHGGVYQAGNWIYSGQSEPSVEYIGPDGKRWHARMVNKKGWSVVHGKRRAVLKPHQCRLVRKPGKYRYLMPLDAAMRAQVASLAKPYPRRVKQATDGDQLDGGGATPTHALQTSEAA